MTSPTARSYRTTYSILPSLLILILLGACGSIPITLPPDSPGTSARTATNTYKPTRTAIFPPTSTAPKGHLKIVSPSEGTQLSGGQDLRVVLEMTNIEGQPVEDASVAVEMWLPNGDLFISDDCRSFASNLFDCPTVTLPLRGAGGAWRILAGAS
jgi:hypothetical protein